MKVTRALILLVFVFPLSAHADEIHPSKQFEAMLVACLPGGTSEENCLVNTILQFTKNARIQRDLPRAIGGLFTQIIGDRKVSAVHPVLSKQLGDFIVEENIVIEDHAGGISLLRVSFSKMLGVWQVRNVHISSKNETIEKALGVKI